MMLQTAETFKAALATLGFDMAAKFQNQDEKLVCIGAFFLTMIDSDQIIGINVFLAKRKRLASLKARAKPKSTTALFLNQCRFAQIVAEV
jgi:hypothetical protein